MQNHEKYTINTCGDIKNKSTGRNLKIRGEGDKKLFFVC